MQALQEARHSGSLAQLPDIITRDDFLLCAAHCASEASCKQLSSNKLATLIQVLHPGSHESTLLLYASLACSSQLQVVCEALLRSAESALPIISLQHLECQNIIHTKQALPALLHMDGTKIIAWQCGFHTTCVLTLIRRCARSVI